jgi:hypothetical protein
MMRISLKSSIPIFPIAALLLLLCGFSADKPASKAAPASAQVGAPIIVTAAPVIDAMAALSRPDGERFPKGAHLLIVRDGKAEPLVPNFAASADANVSFDGKTVLFAGKQDAGNPWKIWEMTLADQSVRLVAAGETDMVRPLYLPDKRVVYAHRGAHGFALEAVWWDGTGLVELSHIQASALPVDVMQDGRVLFEAGFPLGSWGKPELYLVYSDGSGVESFRCDHSSIGSGRWGGYQLASGDVIFTHGPKLAKFTSPLATESPVTAPAAEYAGQIAETPTGAWLASTLHGTGRYALSLVKPGSAILQPIYVDPANNIVEPVLLLPRTTPKRHPTALHEWTTANLLALDVRISRDGDLRQSPPIVRLEQQDENGTAVTMGTSPVEPDGSFYIKVSGDRPIRFTLLDAQGNTVRAEHGWFWIRPGEQRICVGCHAGPEHAPENRVPQVLLRTITPVDLTKHGYGAAKATAGGN